MAGQALDDVYSAREVAEAAAVSNELIASLVAIGEVRAVAALPLGSPVHPSTCRFIPRDEAVRLVRAIRSGHLVALKGGLTPLIQQRNGPRRTAVPLLVSTSLHVLAAAAVALVASLGSVAADEPAELVKSSYEPVRLVFLALPGPGGGGGGGGLRMPAEAPKAERKGARRQSSPLPARKLPPPIRPAPQPVEPPPPPLEAAVLPPVEAPIVVAPADERDRQGVLAQVPDDRTDSQGPGSGRGTGEGLGTGVGEGQGSGLGAGEGGGTGGGPYRPGSGVEPPRLLHEVRADYTDEARRAGVTGEVLLEIVVRRDGSVGDIKVLRGLGSGLDQRAAQAVRGWRFAPARLKGAPVNVVVEVVVEFNLR